ncbi:MAG: bacteriohemerythrin [Cellulosilyticaceae bacterium]
MFDFKFDWDPSISVGIEVIDEQHKELFRIARDLEQLILIECIGVNEEQLLAHLCELREYVTYHFYTEEKIIETYCSKEILDEHKKLHGNFKTIINKIDCIALVNDPVTKIKQLKVFLQEWLFKHILVEDKLIFNQIEEEKTSL